MGRVEPAAVIDHLEGERAGVISEPDHHSTRMRVVFDVVQGFLGDSENDQLVDLKRAFYIGLGLGVLGAIGTFPTFFQIFAA